MPSPPLPSLHATHAGIWIAGRGEDGREASRGEAIARAAETPHIILNAPLVGQRLGYPDLSGLDLHQEPRGQPGPGREVLERVAGGHPALTDAPAESAEETFDVHVCTIVQTSLSISAL